MGMAQPGYPRAGSRRQCEAVFWSTSLLLLLASSSAYPAMRQWRSQRKLGVHRFLLVGQPNRVPTPPHMNNPLPACRRVSLQAMAARCRRAFLSQRETSKWGRGHILTREKLSEALKVFDRKKEQQNKT